MRAVRRLLCRAALLRWIRPRALERSRIGWATSNAARAPAASLASSALSTFLTAVRSIERWLALRALRTTACLARFLDDLMLATKGILGTIGKQDRKLWAIRRVRSTWGPLREGRPGPPAFRRRLQRHDPAVPAGRVRPGHAPGAPVRGLGGHGRLRGGLPDPQLPAPDLRRGLDADGLRAGLQRVAPARGQGRPEGLPGPHGRGPVRGGAGGGRD